MPQLIVFDLDDTLLDTSSILIPIARTPAFYQRIREPLPLMEGALENLQYLAARYKLALLTYGHIESQKQKVASLGIATFFSEMCFADPQKQETKLQYFNKWNNFLSVGNRLSTDIREAKIAGGLTCHFRYGEHITELPERAEDHPDFSITHHRELRTTCQL